MTERVEQTVGPRAGGVGEQRFHGLLINLGNRARRRLDDEENARERRVRDVLGDGRLASVELIFEKLLGLLAKLDGVLIARHEDVAGDEAFEDVLAREERDTMAFLQQQDAARDVEELRVRDLEKLVARKGLEDVDERFSVVTVRIEAGALDGARRFQAQHGDFAHAAAVRGGGEEPEETILAGQVAVVVIALDTDAVERHVAMDGAAAVGFGDDEKVFGARVLAELARERRGGALGGHFAELAQDAEAALDHRREVVLVGARFQSVAAESEKDEVALVEPLQELTRLGYFLLRHRQFGVFELGELGAELRAHGLPVGDRGANVVQDALERGAHRGELRRVALLIDLDVHVRLDNRVDLRFLRRFELDALRAGVAADAHDRMQQQMNVASKARDLGADGIDEERHVVVDDLDDGVLETPAISVDGGIEEPHFGSTDVADFAELPERKRRAEERLERGVDDVVGSDEREVAPDELLGTIRFIAADSFLCFGSKPLDEIGLALLRGHGHESRLLQLRAAIISRRKRTPIGTALSPQRTAVLPAAVIGCAAARMLLSESRAHRKIRGRDDAHGNSEG